MLMAYRVCAGFRSLLVTVGVLSTLAWHAGSHAFRNCDPSLDSEAFRGSSRYFIGELEFAENGGAARGTETHYNYSNIGDNGLRECHVTYSITGVYEPASALFLLDAERTGHSHGCERDLIEANYPMVTSYTLQVTFHANGLVDVMRADSGETVGTGSWGEGVVSYKTEEVCELY
jgi:hypothetical protein